MLLLETLLQPFGLNVTEKAKLVRHQDQRFDVNSLYRAGQFEIYQSLQGKKIFGDAKTLISFLGKPGTHAVFVGVYQINGVEGPNDFPLPKAFIFPDFGTRDCYRYQLTRDTSFDDLRNRLVIDWGAGTRSWVQNFRLGDKRVIEVLPKGYVREFPGFMDVVLRYDELVDIVSNPTAHRDWHRMLRSVAAIYLILDTKTGNQYVGSAYGENGLLSRWATYAGNGHGGNEQLRSLVGSRPEASRDLQFSILQTLPIILTSKEVIAYEVLHKRKLGTRAHGLNSN
jgi:hypothetical protein